MVVVAEFYFIDADGVVLIDNRHRAVLEEGVLDVVFDGDREAYDLIREEGQLQRLADRSFYNNIRAYDRYIADREFNAVAFADDL